MRNSYSVVMVQGWVQKMIGHETLQMIHERHYSHTRNYQRQDGSSFMEKVYKPILEAGKVGEKCVPDQKCDLRRKGGVSP
jgi:hypothetical protein